MVNGLEVTRMDLFLGLPSDFVQRKLNDAMNEFVHPILMELTRIKVNELTHDRLMHYEQEFLDFFRREYPNYGVVSIEASVDKNLGSLCFKAFTGETSWESAIYT